MVRLITIIKSENFCEDRLPKIYEGILKKGNDTASEATQYLIGPAKDELSQQGLWKPLYIEQTGKRNQFVGTA